MANDLWRTPPEVFNTLNQECKKLYCRYGLAPTRTRFALFTLAEEDDSLSFNWARHPALQSERLEYVWLNCPYSNLMPWVKQAAQAQLHGTWRCHAAKQ